MIKLNIALNQKLLKAKKKYFFLICLIFLTVIGFFFIAREKIFPSAFRPFIFKEAATQNFDPFLIAAVICSESHFGSSKVSHAGAIGLMQIRPSTLQELERLKITKIGQYKKQDLLDPVVNIYVGVSYMRLLIERVFASKERREKVQNWYEGDPTALMLHSYNAGPTLVLTELFDHSSSLQEYEAMMQKKRPFTLKYTDDVLKTYKYLQRYNRVLQYE